MVRNLSELEVYKLAIELAMEVFEVSKKFPSEEKYSLTDQIRRSSRSVAANIAEGWGKRKYISVFKKQIIDASGSLEETKSWLEFSLKCEYITQNEFDNLMQKSEFAGGKLHRLYENWS